MIAIIDVSIQSANPSMPLFPWRAFINSPSSIRVRNVPKRIGKWSIEKVYVTAAYPDNSVKTTQCVLTGGIWVGTIAGSTRTGKSQNGYTIFADGTDENGNAVTGYILGKGNIQILEADGTITPSENAYYVHMLSSQPATPKEGDLWQISGSWYIQQDGQAWPIGDDSGLIAQISANVGELSSLANDAWSMASDAQAKAIMANEKFVNYEPISSMTSDVSSIVLSAYVPAGSTWTIQFPEELELLNIRVESGPTYGGDDIWYLTTTVDDDDVGTYLLYWHAGGSEDDAMLWFECDSGERPWEAIAKRQTVNALGLAMESELSSKQDKLLDAQVSAIDSIVDERATVIEFADGTTSSFNWAGTVDQITMSDAELFDASEDMWIKWPAKVKIGSAVNSVGNRTFAFCNTLSSIALPSTISSIGSGAFQNCSNLAELSIPNSIATNLEYDTFTGCHALSTIIVEGKTQAQAEALLAGADVPTGCEIKTWNDASQEWVDSKLSDEYVTTVNFYVSDDIYSTQKFNWVGEVNADTVSGLALSTIAGIEFGRSVSAIADGTFKSAGNQLHEVYFKDSLRYIGVSAFAGNNWLYKVVYGDDKPTSKLNDYYNYGQNAGGELSVGDSAFQGCTSLGYVVLPDIDKLTVGENVFTGCNFTYNTATNGNMIPTAGLFFRNFYNSSAVLNPRLNERNLSAERDKGICHPYIPATKYDIEAAGAEYDAKYLGVYDNTTFTVSVRGANLNLKAYTRHNIHLSADPASNKTKTITIPGNIAVDHSPRSLTVDLSVDAGVTFAGTVNKLTAVDWYLDGTLEEFRNEFLSAGVEIMWECSEYQPNKWYVKKLGMR